MEIIQKRLSEKHVFTFNKDKVNFAYQDRTGSGDIDVTYADIPKKTSVRITENTWLRNVGWIWCVIGVLGLILQQKFVFWLFVGIGCLIWSHFTKKKYTVLNTDKGAIWVMQDKNHDEIISELHDRRKLQLLDWYGEVNPENELANEIRKFNWLAEEGVISQTEAEQKIAQAQIAHQSNLVPPDDKPLLN